jgi:hypothetical protein
MRRKRIRSSILDADYGPGFKKLRGKSCVARVISTLMLSLCASLAPSVGLQQMGIDKEDRIGWRKMNQLLQIHSMTHLADGMTTRDKVESLQRMRADVQALHRSESDGPLLDALNSAQLSERLRAGSIFFRNGTIYGKPLPLTPESLKKLNQTNLRHLGKQLGVAGLGEGGVGVGKRIDLEKRLLAVNSMSRPLQDRLMCLSKRDLSAILLRLGMRARGTGLTKRDMVKRIMWPDRHRFTGIKDLKALLREKDTNNAYPARSRAEVLRAIALLEDMQQFTAALVALQAKTSGELFEQLQKLDAAPLRMHTNAHGAIGGMVCDSRQAAWLRNLGCRSAKDTKKGDWVYGNLLQSHPVLTLSLVDEQLVRKLADLNGSNADALGQIAHRSRQTLCYARARATYRHSNSDGTWTVMTSAGERLRVGCGVDVLLRVNKKSAGYPMVLAAKVQALMRGEKVSHLHTTAPCLLCDKRFDAELASDNDGSDGWGACARRDSMRTRLRKSDSLLRAKQKMLGLSGCAGMQELARDNITSANGQAYRTHVHVAPVETTATPSVLRQEQMHVLTATREGVVKVDGHVASDACISSSNATAGNGGMTRYATTSHHEYLHSMMTDGREMCTLVENEAGVNQGYVDGGSNDQDCVHEGNVDGSVHNRRGLLQGYVNEARTYREGHNGDRKDRGGYNGHDVGCNGHEVGHNESSDVHVKKSMREHMSSETNATFECALKVLRSFMPPKRRGGDGTWSRRQAEALCKSKVSLTSGL